MARTPDAVVSLQERLADAAAAPTKDWWDRYLKGAIEFRGVPMAGIRAAVHGWFGEDIEAAFSPAGQRALARTLIRQPLAEDKLAGILLLQEILLPAGHLNCTSHVAELGRLFDEGAVADWNTCDWLCVRVLGPLADHNGEDCARTIAGWSSAADVWRARAGGVAFVNLAPAGDGNFAGFTEMVLGTCERNVARSERFAQTGVGWVLRDLSIAEPDAVAAFVRRHAATMSREAARSAVRKLPDAVAEELLILHAGRGARA